MRTMHSAIRELARLNTSGKWVLNYKKTKILTKNFSARGMMVGRKRSQGDWN